MSSAPKSNHQAGKVFVGDITFERTKEEKLADFLAPVLGSISVSIDANDSPPTCSITLHGSGKLHNHTTKTTETPDGALLDELRKIEEVPLAGTIRARFATNGGKYENEGYWTTDEGRSLLQREVGERAKVKIEPSGNNKESNRIYSIRLSGQVDDVLTMLREVVDNTQKRMFDDQVTKLASFLGSVKLEPAEREVELKTVLRVAFNKGVGSRLTLEDFNTENIRAALDFNTQDKSAVGLHDMFKKVTELLPGDHPLKSYEVPYLPSVLNAEKLQAIKNVMAPVLADDVKAYEGPETAGSPSAEESRLWQERFDAALLNDPERIAALAKGGNGHMVRAAQTRSGGGSHQL